MNTWKPISKLNKAHSTDKHSQKRIVTDFPIWIFLLEKEKSLFINWWLADIQSYLFYLLVNIQMQ